MASSSLKFSRSNFAKLSPHPYLLANLTDDKRTNGRAPLQSRDLQIHTSSLSHAHGSALVRTGDTTVICGVRGELLPVTSIPNFRPRGTLAAVASTTDPKALGARELKDYDLLVPNIELATGCAPQFLPGVPPTTLAQTLSTRVYSLLHSSGLLDVEDLEVWHTPARDDEDGRMETEDGENADNREETQPELMAYWTLYIDLLFISLDGNPFDAAWVAVLAALRDTTLPTARWDPDSETVVCSRKEQPKKLRVSGLPVACTSAVFQEKEVSFVGSTAAEGRHWLLVDPDRLEESLCEETVTMVVDKSQGETRIRSLEKLGGASLGAKEIGQYARLAERRWAEVQKAIS